MKPAILVISIVAASVTLNAQVFTRGVGVYPGDPKAYNGAVFIADTQTYRNLALHRPAYSSSSYDYNLTAQLLTDGIRDDRIPRWVSTASSVSGMLPRKDREHPVDDNPITSVDLPGSGGWVQVEPGGRGTPLEVDRVDVVARAWSSSQQPGAWTCVVLGSDDGSAWTELGRANGSEVPPAPEWMHARQIKPSILFSSAARNRFYRLQIDGPNVGQWQLGEMSLFDKNKHIEVGGPYDFTSSWKSAGNREEWVYVDLGAICTLDHVVLFWVERATEGVIQISDDAQTWRTVQALLPTASLTDDFKLSQPERARYVRVLMTRAASPDGYVLSEMEVFGRGGPVPRPQLAPGQGASERIDLARGKWRIQRDSLVMADGLVVSKPGFSTTDWLPATVPGTALSSYWDDGVVPDPNYGRNQLQISDSFFYANFWYRDEFTIPVSAPGRHTWLNFDGINWKADVFFNGEKLGRVEGGFMRGKFDVTRFVRPGANALAVLVIKNASPGSVKEKTLAETDSNGGALGADNPTAHASIGWDWIPTIRGRNTGIWGGVYLTTSGPVTIEKPFVSTTLPLPDVSHADVHVQVTLRNYDRKEVVGTLRGEFGSLRFAKHVTVPAGSDLTVKLDPSTTPALHLQAPKLWWPAGYGDPSLYDVKLSFETGLHNVSDRKSFRTGVRQFTYSDEDGAIKIYINGRRFIARGGNWGFPESMLRYRVREYDAAVRYHKEMNFTMIRNWVGQTGDEAFFEACDKYGIVIWQDFWLANPYDGPDPDDNDLFMKNATDFVERIRNHPSIGLFCGRNEGDPPKPLEDGLTDLIGRLDPGIRYFPASSYGPVSGGGPYRAMPARFYFTERATPKLHSELGMPNIVTMDSLRQMMPAADIWPQSDDWGMHDFTLTGAQNLASYRKLIEESYGPAASAEEWVELAQLENYDGYRAMFEAQSKNRMGLLLWMSHPTWPDFVWQTYDYYFEPTAAYFGSKKASEPLHIQWNPLTDNVEVVNYSAGKVNGLTAQVEILNMDGSTQWQRTASLGSAEDSVLTPIKIEYPDTLSPVHFVRLRLTRAGETLSQNFYWRGLEEGNFRTLRKLPKVPVSVTTHVETHGQSWLLTTELGNHSSTPALMVRVKAVREKSGDRILPAIYSDNYVALMPGETRTIQTTLEDMNTRGEHPRIVVEGFNLAGGVRK
ncbi:MAG TPA: discoidin domain-containing protein [Candidatus Sulfotelmatobacter sp.]|nr:discoidin domain-containing protein [Candidatus Sulfotelmatobacter sp.]